MLPETLMLGILSALLIVQSRVFWIMQNFIGCLHFKEASIFLGFVFFMGFFYRKHKIENRQKEEHVFVVLSFFINLFFLFVFFLYFWDAGNEMSILEM